MINCFFLVFAQIASIQNSTSPHSKLVQCQNPPPSSFPCKEPTQRFQTKLVGNASEFSKEKDYIDLTKNLPHLVHCQTILFSIPMQNNSTCNFLKKVLTSSSSQSWICLVNLGFQHLPSPVCSHISATHACLEEAIESSIRKASLKGSSLNFKMPAMMSD